MTMANDDLKPYDGGRNPLDQQLSGLLKSMYGAVENEPIPVKFLDLLERLDQAEKEQQPPPGKGLDGRHD